MIGASAGWVNPPFKNPSHMSDLLSLYRFY